MISKGVFQPNSCCDSVILWVSRAATCPPGHAQFPSADACSILLQLRSSRISVQSQSHSEAVPRDRGSVFREANQASCEARHQ